MDRFPQDFNGGVTGFGGDPSQDRAKHRDLIKRTPIVLVHGNAGHSAHPKWGMVTMAQFLKAAGYIDCEIWAPDHLGVNNTSVDLNDPHKNHIERFRTFVDAVRDYLGVKKLDFIAHSLGCGMVNAYLRGLEGDGTWDWPQNRLGAVSTFVSLAGGTYGLGLNGIGEFKTGSTFERDSHILNDFADDTPQGSSDLNRQESPSPDWKVITPLDNDDNEITYVAITAVKDFVDQQNPDTGRREGAHVNKRFNLGLGIDGHEKIIKSSTVFDLFKSFLDQNPPIPRAMISIDKDSDNYRSGLTIIATVTPTSLPVRYMADCVTTRFDSGYIVRTPSQSVTGTLASGQSLTLPADGAWEVAFRADGADEVRRTYGVNVIIPEVHILTDNMSPFVGSLDVKASTTKGTLYYSSDRENWISGAIDPITRTTTVSFIAIDADAIGSAIVSRAFEKSIPWEETKTASLTEHFMARRLTVDQYVSLGLELGFTSQVTLYLIGGTWVTNPENPQVIELAVLPAGGRVLATMAGGGPISIRTDKPSGEYPEAFDANISASGGAGEDVTVYYAEDGSDPSDRNNPHRQSFRGGKTFTIKGNGPHSILCYVRDDAGNEVFDSVAWSIND